MKHRFSLNDFFSGVLKKGSPRSLTRENNEIKTENSNTDDEKKLWQTVTGLLEQNRRQEAIMLLDHATQRMPNVAWVHNTLAQTLAEDGELQRSVALYRQSAERFYPNSSKILLKQPHDQQQREYLESIGKSSPEFFLERCDRIDSGALNPELNKDELIKSWNTNQPQHIVIDNLLTPDALKALHQYCLHSTIWQISYSDGYMGAAPEHGLGNPLLIQIVEELRKNFSAILEDHPLHYYWAFKYDSHMGGTKVHADSAIININFWLTPDIANQNPHSGGLVLWDKPAPKDWAFQDYNVKTEIIPDYLREVNARATVIPYKCNRAVVFNSSLFHKTDDFSFKEGYENSRINLTLLFGRRL